MLAEYFYWEGRQDQALELSGQNASIGDWFESLLGHQPIACMSLPWACCRVYELPLWMVGMLRSRTVGARHLCGVGVAQVGCDVGAFLDQVLSLLAGHGGRAGGLAQVIYANGGLA
jgi:hypothetical protein